MKAVPFDRYILFLAIAGAGCAIDLATKSWVFSWLGMPLEQPSYWLWDGVFGFTTSLNQGALFGIGQGKVPLFVVLSLAAVVGIVGWLFLAGGAIDRWLTVALAGVMGGVLGNLYDRLGLPGLVWNMRDPYGLHQPGDPVYAVRDWLHFKVDAIHLDWPIFNIADSLLVVGAGMLVWHALRSESAAEPSSATAAGSR